MNGLFIIRVLDLFAQWWKSLNEKNRMKWLIQSSPGVNHARRRRQEEKPKFFDRAPVESVGKSEET
ncbi:unnamed protein product [Sphenostylis stenocarpa]|uniref:Uncharacterized protein n=1 Tax=Sphenostylis stenocarpa TaxID=92480 RepID=A0AA86VWS6_9FABA|nr:unnamed protein product [Sphenostylis stenocarpa]